LEAGNEEVCHCHHKSERERREKERERERETVLEDHEAGFSFSLSSA